MKSNYCDGLTRRDALRVGVLGGAGLTLSEYLRITGTQSTISAAEKGVAKSGKPTAGKAKSAIFIFLTGGPSHLDTFDMKPNAPAEIRGEYNPIKTNVPGIEICQHLPKLAQMADQYAILRGVSHNVAAHPLGQLYLNTGNRPLPSLTYPGYGSVVSKLRKSDPELPSFVAIPNTKQSAGFLGVRYSPLQTNATPRPGQPFNVRGISLGRGLTPADIDRRERLLRDVDKTFESLQKNSDLLDGLDKFSQQAYAMVSSRRARLAFDISRETPEVAARFGESPFGLSCLLASRLVESEVPFITLTSGGWDTHNQNFTKLKGSLLPQLDAGLSGLFSTLKSKGLLDSTAVVVTGEFGRTPKINARGGRDHWARAMFVLAGGGGFKGGQVIGASDEKGMGPAEKAITPDDMAASLYHALGIDHRKEFLTNTGRPVQIVRNGNVIQPLFG